MATRGMVIRAFFVESMQAQNMRRLAGSAVFELVRSKRPRACGASVHLVVDSLTVRLVLWWPWLLVPFSAPVVWLIWRWRVSVVLEQLRVPMRRLSVRVSYAKKKPKDSRR